MRTNCCGAFELFKQAWERIHAWDTGGVTGLKAVAVELFWLSLQPVSLGCLLRLSVLQSTSYLRRLARSGSRAEPGLCLSHCLGHSLGHNLNCERHIPPSPPVSSPTTLYLVYPVLIFQKPRRKRNVVIEVDGRERKFTCKSCAFRSICIFKYVQYRLFLYALIIAFFWPISKGGIRNSSCKQAEGWKNSGTLRTTVAELK